MILSVDKLNKPIMPGQLLTDDDAQILSPLLPVNNDPVVIVTDTDSEADIERSALSNAGDNVESEEEFVVVGDGIELGDGNEDLGMRSSTLVIPVLKY